MTEQLEQRLSVRIQRQREEGGNIMDYGTPDPLDVAALNALRRYREALTKIAAGQAGIKQARQALSDS